MRYLACVAMLVVPVVAAQSPVLQPNINIPAIGSLSAPTGRFVFGRLSDVAGLYMLDTQTGRLWTAVTVRADATDKGHLALMPVPYYTDKLLWNETLTPPEQPKPVK